MESSEEDAGTATNASRRESAREKNLGQLEDVNATSSFQQDTLETRTSCHTPAMSEDNFDGDSVPSPSTHDVNTSTEAILDMIDEIVDGPGAPKRLPLLLDTDAKSLPVQQEHQNIETEPVNSEECSSKIVSEPVFCATVEEKESSSVDSVVISTECTQTTESDPITVSCALPNPSPIPSAVDSISSVESEEASSSEKLPSSPLPNISPSSVNKTEQSVSERENEHCERTVKCVTSSDSRDKVVVESAESTSSDISVSEEKTLSVEPVTRSPLRRRLVRPALHRPDSTVSSTVDSSISTHTPEQSSECITKDVSSSSDAVSTVHDSVKSEEIRNVSEISICKAETSSSPPKKIRLIRQKIHPQVNHTDNLELIKQSSITESEQCQSTSSEGHASQKDIIPIDVTLEPTINLQSNENVINKSSVQSIESRENTTEQQVNTQLASVSLKVSEISNENEIDKNHEKISPPELQLPSTNVDDTLIESSPNERAVEGMSKEGSTLDIQDNKELQNIETEKTVPKLTIKVNNKSCDESKSPVPKLTIKPLKAPTQTESESLSDEKLSVPSITKLNIKPIPKPAEKINELHRKSSSSEISESEYSENDDSASTSDQASASDQGPTDVVPKVTIKLGKPGTETEGKFYTEPNIPKLTIKGIQNSNEEGRESPSKLKVIICQSEENQIEKVPKLTIKSIPISETQPLSPKLTVKPLKPPDSINRENKSETSEPPPIPKLKISTDSANSDLKDVSHVPKITIKPIAKPDNELVSKTPKKALSENLENIPVITKLNIKPIMKPENSIDVTNKNDDKVPVVSKINIKPIVNPNEVDLSKEDIPKVTKLNIKPIKSPEGNSSKESDCDDVKTNESIPIVTKLNIKPIVKPSEEDISKESENHSSETGTSSDENNDHIPIVTKINIKPICKPSEKDEFCHGHKEDNIPIVTKLNIKPLVKPDSPLPLSPKKERTSSPEHRNQNIPVVTKLNIKPIVKPEEIKQKMDAFEDSSVKNPPLLMRINRKTRTDSGSSDTQYHINKSDTEHFNNINENIPAISKINIKPVLNPESESRNEQPESKINAIENDNNHHNQEEVPKLSFGGLDMQKELKSIINYENKDNIDKVYKQIHEESINEKCTSNEDKSSISLDVDDNKQNSNVSQNVIPVEKCSINDLSSESHHTGVEETESISNLKEKALSSKTNCTLLKKLLESNKNDDSTQNDDSKVNVTNCVSPIPNETLKSPINDICSSSEPIKSTDLKHNKRDLSPSTENIKEMISGPNLIKVRSMQDLCKEMNESVTKPLEINISDKINQSPDQDSPRIILKINKTDHGASAKIITEDMLKSENKNATISDSMINKRRSVLNRKKHQTDMPSVVVGKRLRSSRVVQSPEKSPFTKRSIGKRSSNTDAASSPPSPKESELSMLDTKRLKLGQLLSNKSLTITPVKSGHISPTNSLEIKQAKIVNHSLLNNENCSKNGSSKLHNILSNLQSKQLKVMPLNDLHHSDRKQSVSPELKSSTSLDSNPNINIEISPVDQNCSETRETIFQESVESRDFNITPDPLSQDPLEVGSLKPATDFPNSDQNVPLVVEITPQPKKRGRPRKLPVSEGAKPITLPTPALEERPQRSLRLSRDRPAILVKPRGRGRGRGRRVNPEPNPALEPEPEPIVETANKFFISEQKTEEIDPTSSRIKLPRLTEALDKMPSTCLTPLTSRRRNSSTSDMKFFGGETPELKVVLETTLPRMENPFAKSPEVISEFRGRGRGGRGSRGGRGRASPRTPRGRGRGRGGGRGAMYMKETMGIYGRVCGPATTTVQLFEEETCMMDDNATPAKPSHLLDEDSQSSVKSSTNESSKMKKSKFADLFDSNKVWAAADVKEYTWPPPEQTDTDHQVMMIQEQVAMFLSVKSFKRRYPELKRRTITGPERDYVLSKGLVSEALCDLGITAVDASEVLDIMLSDYPHKYEEYRSYQREKQLAEPAPAPQEMKTEVKDNIDIKSESKSLDSKPDLPKIDPEKMRQDMAAAAIASASEWNARMNALRRPACVDLQSLTIQRRRAPPPASPAVRVEPPHGFYPHALLPGQYQHTYRVYSAEHLRYFPLNTALTAPAAPPSPAPSSCGSEPDWGSSSDDSADTHRHQKRKKLTKVKRSSDAEVAAAAAAAAVTAAAGEEGEPDTCRSCKLRIEANRKTTHERFLVCAYCNAKLHPSCVELSADTIRKCREYAWQCADCKTCGACERPVDADKMLFCDLCDRGFHIYCVGLERVPDGRWHCVECAICKSCGARSPSGPGSNANTGQGAGQGSSQGAVQGSVTPRGPGSPHWHHQTRRGPGGHKVYSHSLCEPCARAYRIGRYCPLCDRSFIGPKGTMQLVICKLCDRQLHQDCVKRTASTLNVLDYTCGECRRGGITSRAAAVRLAPRTIATLFMAKRRFNKYAHRQYMQKCMRGQGKADGSSEPPERPDDATDGSDNGDDAGDPLDGVGD